MPGSAQRRAEVEERVGVVRGGVVLGERRHGAAGDRHRLGVLALLYEPEGLGVELGSAGGIAATAGGGRGGSLPGLLVLRGRLLAGPLLAVAALLLRRLLLRAAVGGLPLVVAAGAQRSESHDRRERQQQRRQHHREAGPRLARAGGLGRRRGCAPLRAGSRGLALALRVRLGRRLGL